MRKNMLKEKIRNGESAIGTFVKLTDPAVPELLALAGFDFFVLDTEHVAVDREQLSNIVRQRTRPASRPLCGFGRTSRWRSCRIWTWDMRACRCPM